MKKSALLLFASIFIFCNSFKTPTEITWLDFNTGYALAQKKKKPMLVDVYTDWCGWCKVMDKETYSKSEIIELIGSKFIAVKFNPEVANVTYTYEGKEYKGKDLQQAISNNQLRGYPATIFIDTKTKKQQLVSGYKRADEFKAILEGVIKDTKAK